MYGGYNSWLVTRLGGLSSISNATTSGWKDILVRPNPTIIATLKTGCTTVDFELISILGAFTFESRFGATSLAWELAGNKVINSGLV